MNVDIIEKTKKNIDEDIKVSSSIDILKLKDVQDYELQNKSKSELKVISAEYVGNYNDTTVYNVEISLNGVQEYITLERKLEDWEAKHKWEVFSNLTLNDKENDYIIQTVSNNPPRMSLDAPPTIYENTSIEEIEIGG